MKDSVTMNPQLTILLEIQDLRGQVKELRSEPQAGEIQAQHFDLDIDDAVAQIEAKIGELENELDARVQRRYRRVADSVDRVVVPVINGTCYGCFVAIPTATAGEEDPNTSLQSCENCGRFIYILV